MAHLPDPQNCCEYVTSEVKGASTVKTVYKFESQYLVHLVNKDDALHRGDERISYENGEWQIQEIYRNQYNRYKILFSSNSSEACPENIDGHTWTTRNKYGEYYDDYGYLDIRISCLSLDTPWHENSVVQWLISNLIQLLLFASVVCCCCCCCWCCRCCGKMKKKSRISAPLRRNRKKNNNENESVEMAVSTIERTEYQEPSSVSSNDINKDLLSKNNHYKLTPDQLKDLLSKNNHHILTPDQLQDLLSKNNHHITPDQSADTDMWRPASQPAVFSYEFKPTLTTTMTYDFDYDFD